MVTASTCPVYHLGGIATAPPSIIASADRLIIAVRGTNTSGFGVFANEWVNGGSLTKTNASPDGWYFVNNAGNTSKSPELVIESGKPTIYIQGAFPDGNPIAAFYKTQYISKGVWSGWAQDLTRSSITPGPTTALFQGKTYNVRLDTDSSILLEECAGSGSTDTITISKTYLGVSPTAADTEVELDNGTFVSGNPAVFSNVSAGSHTIAIEVPVGVKAFYAICTNAATCIAGFVDGGVGFGTGSGVKTLKSGLFIHQAGKNDYISVFYTSTDMVYTSQSVEFGLDDLFRVPKALAVTLVPTQVPWLDPIPNQPGQYALACSRTFYVADVVGDQGAIDGAGDLYAEALAALTAWDEAVNIQPLFGGTYFPQATGSINGITTYKVLDELDGKDVIGYVDPALIGGSGFVGIANTSGFGKTRGIVDFGTQTDIGLDATEGFYIGNDGPAGWFHLPTTLKHELGHALGLGELDEAPLGTSIMTTPGKPTNFIQGITDNDIYTINLLYEKFLNQSCGFLPKKAHLSVEFLANPAPLSGVSAAPACRGYPDAAWYKINTKIQEIGGVGVTLKNLLTSYYIQNNAQGTPLQTYTSPFSSFLQSAAGAKGFGSEKLTPFGNVTGILCQVPWRPEQLGSLTLKVQGTDDKGNSVEASNALNLASPVVSSSRDLLAPQQAHLTLGYKTVSQNLASVTQALEGLLSAFDKFLERYQR